VGDFKYELPISIATVPTGFTGKNITLKNGSWTENITNLTVN